jgi:hypothetical protein
MWQGYTTLTYGEDYWTHYVRLGLWYSERLYGISFYVNARDIVKALALAHFPLAAIFLIVGFLSLNNRKQNLTFYSLLLPALGAYILCPPQRDQDGGSHILRHHAARGDRAGSHREVLRTYCETTLAGREELASTFLALIKVACVPATRGFCNKFLVKNH